MDANYCNVLLEYDKLELIFNNENDIVMSEYVNGDIKLAANTDLDILESAIYEWRDKRPDEFERIILDEWCMDNLKGDDFEYFIEITD